MAEPRQDWKFGHIYTPDEAWLAAAADESVLEPDLPIVDPHHHLWQRGDHRYFLDELLADLNTGHNSSQPCSWNAARCTARAAPPNPGPSARPNSSPASPR